jgi:mannose-6-phosphate isomerase-like protein (cupin superfamily)
MALWGLVVAVGCGVGTSAIMAGAPKLLRGGGFLSSTTPRSAASSTTSARFLLSVAAAGACSGACAIMLSQRRARKRRLRRAMDAGDSAKLELAALPRAPCGRGGSLHILLDPLVAPSASCSVLRLLIPPLSATKAMALPEVTQIYHVAHGRGIFFLNDAEENLGVGDSLLIRPGSSIAIANGTWGAEDLVLEWVADPALPRSKLKNVLVPYDDGAGMAVRCSRLVWSGLKGVGHLAFRSMVQEEQDETTTD